MAADNKLVPFMEGRNTRFVFFQDRVRQSLPFKTTSIKPNVTKHADGVNGEQRDRLSVTVNYYELSAQMFMKDATALKLYLAAQAARDAMTAPLDQDGAIRFYPNDGTKQSFVMEDLVMDDFDLSQSGRDQKLMIMVNMRFADLKEAKTV